MTNTFRVRFRFRLQRFLNLPVTKHFFEVAGREVVLSSLADTDISENSWLAMNARGFESEQAATVFANKLKTACEFSSAAVRLGVDAGVDLPTSAFSSLVKDIMLEQSGILLRNNIHGVDVFVDDPDIRIGAINGHGKALVAPDPFLSRLTEFYDQIDAASQDTRDTVLLLNYALMRPDPVAQIVFAFSAVERLGQRDWSARQKKLLTRLADSAEQSDLATPEERHEVANAIRRGTQKVSLRQGVWRLLESLGLEHLKSHWDALYKERSTLVHGLAPKPGVNYSDFAHRVVSLCGRILLEVVAREVERANVHAEQYYPI